jgi:hypothetical protein
LLRSVPLHGLLTTCVTIQTNGRVTAIRCEVTTENCGVGVRCPLVARTMCAAAGPLRPRGGLQATAGARADFVIDCHLGDVQRTVRDGSSELYEIRVPDQSPHWEKDGFAAMLLRLTHESTRRCPH